MTSRRRRHGQRHRFGPRAGHFGPGRRANRGDIRATILRLLEERPMHGYQILQEVAERSEGLWRPSPGSVYPTLQQLEDEELVSEERGEGGKRIFTLTEAGRAEAARQPASPWEQAAQEADDDLVALRDVAYQVMAATRQLAQAGTATQIAAGKELLRETRRRLYGLLADDAPSEDEEGTV